LRDGGRRQVKPARGFRDRALLDDGDKALQKARVHTNKIYLLKIKLSIFSFSTSSRMVISDLLGLRVAAFGKEAQMRMQLLGAAIAVACTASAATQVYPSRTVTINVAFTAGGPLDTVGRILAEKMRAPLGQPVIIENTAGAGGSIGVGRVAHATPDGYTLSLGSWNTHVVNGAVYTLTYDVMGDFEPIALISSNAYLVISRRALPANDLAGLIAWLKANSDNATAGICVGCPQHIFAALFRNATDTRFRLIPYRASAPATQELMAGRIDLMLDSPINALPLVRSGTIKAYAVTAKSRLASAPDVPTVDEAGLPGFYASQWFGLWAPKGTPQEIIRKINSAVVETLADPEVRRRIDELGLEIFPRDQQTPEALRAFHKAEIEKWWPIIKAANIQGDVNH
jgi:tripartite-type tricarboxylate transporter receptor subunit TctC